MIRAALAIGLLAAPLLSAGCIDGPGSLVLTTCAGLDRLQPSRNAPLIAPLALPPDDLARRIAGAARDPLVTPSGAITREWSDPGLRWDTRHGVIERFDDDAGDYGFARYWRNDAHWTPIDGSRAHADLLAFLAVLGVPEDARATLQFESRAQPDGKRLDVQANQRLPSVGAPIQGHPGMEPGLRLWVTSDVNEMGERRSQITLAPLHDLTRATTRLDADAANAIALKAAQCRLADTEGGAAASTASVGTEDPRFVIVAESLGWRTGVGWNRGPACSQSIHTPIVVDATSGAILWYGPDGAGCVE